MNPQWQFTSADFPPQNKAHLIAQDILRNWQIQGLHSTHAITAIEFYVSSPDHCDESNHCHPLQLKSGKWYVHTSKNQRSFKSPRYSGMDLTLGTSPNIHAAMLIRQLDGDGGSGKAIMKLVRGTGVGVGKLPAGHPMLKWDEHELKFLSQLQGQNAFTSSIRLERLEKPLDLKIQAKVRVGIAGKTNAEALLHFSVCR